MRQISLFLILTILASYGCKKDKETDPTPDPKVPVLVKIERLEISGWPPSASDGSGWDPFDAPDIYLKVYNITTLKVQTTVVSNVAPNQTITLDEQITFAPGDIVVLHLYDHDEFDAHDFMGSAQWIAWEPADGEQTVFTEYDDFTVNRIQTYVY